MAHRALVDRDAPAEPGAFDGVLAAYSPAVPRQASAARKYAYPATIAVVWSPQWAGGCGIGDESNDQCSLPLLARHISGKGHCSP